MAMRVCQELLMSLYPTLTNRPESISAIPDIRGGREAKEG